MSQANVKEALLNTINGIKEDPASSMVVFRAETKWEEDVRCFVSIRDFPKFTIDEPPELGGQDSAMNPVEMVLGALGSCQEIIYSAYASVMDIELKSVEVDVRGYLDLQGLFGMDENIPAGFKRVSFETRIESDADEESLRKLIDTVENHCPVLDIFARAQVIKGTASVNGKQLVTLLRNTD
ncbi:MAG: OsmC family protein [Methylococcales bacterium]